MKHLQPKGAFVAPPRIDGRTRLAGSRRDLGITMSRASAQTKEDRFERAPSSDGGEGVVNILIVDDEPKNLTVLETVLELAPLSGDPG